MYYNHRGNFVFPEIDHAWRKDQQQQVDEIKQSGRSLDLALDGQCDSPGHNASYNTVSAMDVSNNKILYFRIVHVKVSRLILLKAYHHFLTSSRIFCSYF